MISVEVRMVRAQSFWHASERAPPVKHAGGDLEHQGRRRTFRTTGWRADREEAHEEAEVGKIFISYRRADSGSAAKRIYDRLTKHFGKRRVFRDVENIPIGADFPRFLEKTLYECTVALILIGPHWLDARAADGRRRLDDSADFVRREVETALARDILVVPLLIDGASMPKADELPESISAVHWRNALVVRPDPEFALDMTRLIEGVDQAARGLGGRLADLFGKGARVALPAAIAAHALADVLSATHAAPPSSATGHGTDASPASQTAGQAGSPQPAGAGTGAGSAAGVSAAPGAPAAQPPPAASVGGRVASAGIKAARAARVADAPRGPASGLAQAFASVVGTGHSSVSAVVVAVATLAVLTSTAAGIVSAPTVSTVAGVTNPAADAASNYKQESAPKSSVHEMALKTQNGGPFAITVARDGAVWFTEYNGDHVGRVGPTGALDEFAVWSETQPTTIVQAPDGTIWFAASARNTIASISPSGDLSERSLDGLSITPVGLTAAADGTLWYTEYDHEYGSNIGSIAPDGRLSFFLLPDNGRQSTSIVEGPDHNLWFTEQAGNAIGKITPAGVITEYPLPTPLAGPTAITVTRDGTLWFTETYANRIGKISLSGQITEIPLPWAFAGPLGIAPAGDNSVWFAEYNRNAIGHLTTGGAMREVAIPGSDAQPTGVAVAPDGTVWFTEYGGNRIGSFKP